MHKRRKVIVVGAGLAGLATAYELAKKPHLEVHLVEQSNRVGGRVHSLDVKGRGVDLGGFIIFPWYTQFHHYLRELNLDTSTDALPKLDVYYDLDEDQNYVSSQNIPWSGWDFIRLVVKSVPHLLFNLDPTSPQLDRFKRRTVQRYLRDTIGEKRSGLFERYFAATSEGYCYGPISEYKVTFGIIAMAKSFIQGNLHTSTYFPQGTNTLAFALADKFESMGGTIHLNKRVKDVKNHVLLTSKGKMEADAIVFAQTVDNKLHSKLLGIKVNCPYTEFVTAVIQTSKEPKVNGASEWGAIFYEPKNDRSTQILSVINLRTLYHSTLKNHFTVNVVLKKTQKRITESQVKSIVEKELAIILPGTKIKKVTTLEHWKQTMPITQESLIETIHHHQGKHGYYFAGDYLGVPSMEAALGTGRRIAKHVSRDLSK